MPDQRPDHHALVDIVTVNWNAGAQLAACVESVQTREPDIVARFTVVDNASHDGSADRLSDWSKLHVDRAGANLGFGRACNRGARLGNAPFLRLLNPDTRLTGSDAISRAATFLLSPAGQPYGVCGIKLIDDTGLASRHCARFPGLAMFCSQAIGLDRLAPRWFPPLVMTEFDHESSRAVDHVQGSFYLVRRSLFESLGGFDEDFFVYYEDLDLSYRAAGKGQRCYYLAQAAAYHRGGGTSQQVKATARFYELEARILYARKHLSPVAFPFFLLFTYLLEPVVTLAWYLRRYGGAGLTKWRDVFSRLAHATPRLLWGHLRGPAAKL